MSTTFPRTRRTRLGYDVDEVERFLEEARRAYVGEQSAGAAPITADRIRTTAFAMRKGGYSPAAVDAALERLEEAFAVRERDRVFAEQGDEAWFTQTRQIAQQILDRLSRPAGRRFRRVGPLTTGYRVRDVDALADRLVEYFQHGKPMTIKDVRFAEFRGAKRGYHEQQVDLLLDSVIRVMLAVR